MMGMMIGARQVLRGRWAGATLLVQLLAAAAAHGQPLDVVRYAPDITTALDGAVVGAGALATDDLNGSVVLLAIPNLPATASIAAAHGFDNGDLLLAFESTVSLPGAGTVDPRDIVLFTSGAGTFGVAVGGDNVGIPSSASIDALAVDGGGNILLSLDVSVGAFDDEDVVRIDGSNLTLFLDLSGAGIAEALDLDGLDVEANGGTTLYVSFDGTGSADAVAFDDEDILAYDLSSMTWALAYDGSAAAAQWPAAADLIALDVSLVAPPTATPTPTTPAATATLTATAPVATETATATATAPGATATATATGTAVEPTRTETATATETAPDATRTSTATPTGSQPATATATATAPSATQTSTATQTAPGATGTVTATATASPTGSLPVTTTATATATVPVGATATLTATATATATGMLPCPGDCNGSGEVTIDELIRLVNIALGNLPPTCPAGDLDSNGVIAINELVAAVNSALNGCPG